MSDRIIKPEVVEAREKEKARARQLERRRLAHDYLVAALNCANYFWEGNTTEVEAALDMADELLKQTEVEP